jgi:hypothetical protein
MVSARQQAANERNAQKSTGPKTPQGKAVSRNNALRHGLRAENILLPGEEPSARATVTEAYYQEFKPVGPVEHRHVERLIAIDWRMRRIEAMETGALTWCSEPAIEAMINDLRMPGSLLTKIWRYDRQLDRSYHQTLKDLRTIQAQREEGEALISQSEPGPAPQPSPDQPVESSIDRAVEAACLPALQIKPLLPPAIASINPAKQPVATRTTIGPNLTLVTRVG